MIWRILIFLSLMMIIKSFPLKTLYELYRLEDNDDFVNAIMKSLIYTINGTLQNSKNLTTECIDIITDLYLNESNQNLKTNYYKTLIDSSKNRNDVSSYSDCMNNRYFANKTILDNFTYIIVYINDEKKKSSSFNEDDFYTFGLCFAKGCSNEEYSQFFLQLNMEIEDPLGFTNNNTNKSLTTISMSYNDNTNHNYSDSRFIFIFLIPFYILVIQLLFMCFPSIPKFLFKKCFRWKNKSTFLNSVNDDHNSDKNLLKNQIIPLTDAQGFVKQNESINKSNRERKSTNKKIKKKYTIDREKLYQFKSAFLINQNSEDLFSFKNSKCYDDSGLSYIKGIIGLSMNILMIGFAYFNLFSSPIKISGLKTYSDLMSSFYYALIFIGIRYSPRILFSCSGYTFIYKFLSYLDEASGNISDKEKEIEKDKNKTSQFEILITELNEIGNNSSKISPIYLFKFIMRQFYKYIIFIIFFLFVKFSLYFLVYYLSNAGPMWSYFKNNNFNNISALEILSTVFLFDLYLFGDKLCIYWMITNEITFFLVSSIIVFISYKKNLRFDILLWFIFFSLIITRFVIYIIKNEEMNSTDFDNYNLYVSMFINPLYNYPYYIIGMFFGKINYVIQRTITFKSAKRSRKSYLIINVYFSRIFRNGKKSMFIILSVICVCTMLIFSISMPILFTIFNIESDQSNMEKVLENKFLNLVYLIDIDIVVIAVHILCLSLLFSGMKVFYEFISNPFWIFIYKLYFSFILLINPVIMYLMNTVETRIRLEWFNLLFFSIMCYFILIGISCFHFIFCEMPYKRISSMILTNREDKDYNDFLQANITTTDNLDNESSPGNYLFNK